MTAASVFTPGTGFGAGSARMVLAGLRAARAEAERVAVQQAELTVEWCRWHAPVGDTEVDRFGVGWVTPGGPGSPEVDESAVAELATALRYSTDSGMSYVGAVLEVCYRLPRLWERVRNGQTPWWRARRIADATIGLSPEAAAFVDERLAAYAGTVSWAQLDRLIDEARILADPEAAEQELNADTRKVEIDTRTVSLTGTVRIEGELDLLDARDLDHALSDIAEDLAACGSTDSLDARRSTALGELARRQPGLPFDAPEPTPAALDRRAPRDVQLHVHISADQLTGSGGPLGRVDSSSPTPASIEAIRAWCGSPDAKVTVRPVLDLAEHVQTDAYQIPDRLREQVVQTSNTCVFPYCNRPARGCDLDHTHPHDRGGPTSSDNLAPLCRKHHRLKGNRGWHYQRLTRGAYLWTTPAGGTYLRDGTGTTDLTPPGKPPPRAPDSPMPHRAGQPPPIPDDEPPPF
ncbi:HNH endonuclease signature motif containing protein [Skermania piniformis]|uniref:HNH endonuclease n=1 Tax=Skermania pinensis TaxID=39122 RepID=A0ABX8SH45_9ACTN|nr:HNH endonuclease signature motif containing protein [Skermania piniformis]QXQ15001.1 HNH endonuclease [Skermania piniformis]